MIAYTSVYKVKVTLIERGWIYSFYVFETSVMLQKLLHSPHISKKFKYEYRENYNFIYSFVWAHNSAFHPMGEGGLGWRVFRMSAWIKSDRMWSVCDNAHFLDFPIAASTARTMGLDTNSLAVCV